MKNTMLVAIAVAALAIASASRAYAEEKTVTGEGSCIKSHEIVIKVLESNKKVTYHLVDNQVTKDFRDQICNKPGRVKATGEVKTVEGRRELTPTSLELVPEKEEGPRAKQ